MSLYLNDTPAFLYYISKYYLIFFILQQVGAEVSGLFALQSVAHLLRLGGVGNHSDRIVIAYVLPEPVEHYHYLVLYAKDRAEVNYQPQYPGKEALAVELAKLYHSLVSSDGSHRTQVLVAERLELGIVCSLCYLLDILGQKCSLLNGYLSQLWMTARISWVCGLDTLIADGKETVHARDAVEFIYYDSETTAQMVAINTRDRLCLYS